MAYCKMQNFYISYIFYCNDTHIKDVLQFYWNGSFSRQVKIIYEIAFFVIESQCRCKVIGTFILVSEKQNWFYQGTKAPFLLVLKW